MIQYDWNESVAHTLFFNYNKWGELVEKGYLPSSFKLDSIQDIADSYERLDESKGAIISNVSFFSEPKEGATCAQRGLLLTSIVPFDKSTRKSSSKKNCLIEKSLYARHSDGGSRKEAKPPVLIEKTVQMIVEEGSSLYRLRREIVPGTRCQLVHYPMVYRGKMFTVEYETNKQGAIKSIRSPYLKKKENDWIQYEYDAYGNVSNEQHSSVLGSTKFSRRYKWCNFATEVSLS